MRVKIKKKAKLVSKIFALFVCSVIFASAILAQEKPQPEFIGEYIADDTNSPTFESMVERLIFRLSNESATSRGIIGIYEKSDLGDKVKAILSAHPQLKGKIIYGLGGKSSRPLLYTTFWIVPKDAEFPDLGCHMPACECPILTVSGVESFTGQSVYPTFTAKTEGGEDTAKITYTWKVSAGRIIEGQGTPVIKVEIEGAKEITATVEIDGVCEECERIKSFTTKIQ